MTKVIGFRQEMMKECTCRECGAIVEHAPHEEKLTDRTDSGTRIRGSIAPTAEVFIAPVRKR